MGTAINRYEALKIVGACALPHVPGFYFARSAWFNKNLNEWYNKLDFPSYRPPNWVFGPVWGGLYTGMGYASYLVYKNGGGFKGSAKLPLALYGTQLILNWAWSPIFFKNKSLKWGAVEITLLTVAVEATAYSFYKIDKTAGYLFIPYIAWLLYATQFSWRLYLKNRAVENSNNKVD